MPCTHRATELANEDAINETEDDDGWVVAETTATAEVADIDGPEDEKKEDEDDNVFAKKEDAPEEEGVERCRRYDISITYDAYYKTPRLWLLGYDESKEVLSTEMFDDVMAEHA